MGRRKRTLRKDLKFPQPKLKFTKMRVKTKDQRNSKQKKKMKSKNKNKNKNKSKSKNKNKRQTKMMKIEARSKKAVTKDQQVLRKRCEIILRFSLYGFGYIEIYSY
jgi:hypothetical protein